MKGFKTRKGRGQAAWWQGCGKGLGISAGNTLLLCALFALLTEKGLIALSIRNVVCTAIVSLSACAGGFLTSVMEQRHKLPLAMLTGGGYLLLLFLGGGLFRDTAFAWKPWIFLGAVVGAFVGGVLGAWKRKGKGYL